MLSVKENQTVKTIRNAYLQLLSEKNKEKVTVTELCRLAHINRVTFYNYYTDQYDLLQDIENNLLNEVRKIVFENKDDADKMVRKFCQEFYKNKNLQTLLAGENEDSSLTEKIYESFTEGFTNNFFSGRKEENLQYQFIIYGCRGIFTNWIRYGFKESPEQMAGNLNVIRREMSKKRASGF